jgi:hypothetical protein
VSKYPSREDLTGEQSEALEKAAFLIISARKEAAAMLARAGVPLPDDGFGFGSPCHAHMEGHGDCPCSDYTGDGGPCLTRTTLDPGASAPSGVAAIHHHFST